MIGRPKKIRRITGIPTVSGFKPYGVDINSKKKDAIFLLYEEYEALKLSDYEGLNQCDAAFHMGISRPTFTRIYMSARKKIAQAFVEGRILHVEGGKVHYNSEWYVCAVCDTIFNNPEKKENVSCPLCGSDQIAACESNESSWWLAEEEKSISEESSSKRNRNRKGCCRQRRNKY